MADTYQFAFGIQMFGDYGFGGYAPEFVSQEQVYIDDDSPLVAYNNALENAGRLAITAGDPVSGFPITKICNRDLISVAKLVTGIDGSAQIVYSPKNTIYSFGFGGGDGFGFGALGFGGYSPLPSVTNCLIMGASRHSANGARDVPQDVRIFAQTAFGASGFGIGGFSGEVILRRAQDFDTSQGSVTYCFSRVEIVGAVLTMKFDTSGEKVLPELFLGDSLRLPHVDFGFDPYHEVTYGATFIAESGREYPQVRYRRMELTPKFSNIERANWAAVDAFRENVTEIRAPFWFAWSPIQNPGETYLMREDGKDFPFPIAHTNFRNLSGKFIEVI